MGVEQANLNEGSDKVLPEPAKPASDPAGGSGGDNCPDQGPSDSSVRTRKPVLDAWLMWEQAKEDLDKAAPGVPGSTSSDGGGNYVDILMRDHLEMED